MISFESSTSPNESQRTDITQEVSGWTLIDHIVDVRNKIAHGDLTVSKTPGDLFEAIIGIKLFFRATDDLFANWCRDNLCRIR